MSTHSGERSKQIFRAFFFPVDTFRVTRRLRYPQCNWAVKSLLPWWHVRATVSHGQSIWVLVLFYMYSTVKIKKTHAFMKHNSSATTRIISKRSMMDIWSVKGRSAASWMETNCVMHWSRAPRCQSRVGWFNFSPQGMFQRTRTAF